MQFIQHARYIFVYSISQKQTVAYSLGINIQKCKNINRNTFKSFYTSKWIRDLENVPKPLASMKPKSEKGFSKSIVDIKRVRVIGGKGGDGNISFLQLWANEYAGPDGGDGGHGGHVIFQATSNVKDLSHLSSVLEAQNGERGGNKDCFGKNAENTIAQIPTGTIVRNAEGKIVADLNREGMMFVAARGGSGGHGNAFFKSDVQQTPQISEYGATGEDLQYILEISSMAHVGLIGFPNVGKSTLLRAISRANPKVAAYPFTTLRPQLGMVLYDDYEQVAVADLPGIIPDSHKNKGLGIQFLKHVERCRILLFMLDLTSQEPWADFETLQYEITQFNVRLNERMLLVVANKLDVHGATDTLKLLKEKVKLPIVPISAKFGTNIPDLLKEIRILYDKEAENVLQENSN